MIVKRLQAAALGSALALLLLAPVAWAARSVRGSAAGATAAVRVKPATAQPAQKKEAAKPVVPAKPGEVRCANLTYGKAKRKTSRCFSDKFLAQIRKDTNIRAYQRLENVKLESPKLCEYPFAVMTGEGEFSLTDAQRQSLKQYLLRGGFVVASAGCSSQPWNKSFIAEMKTIFPDSKFDPLAGDHPIFHTVYDITSSRYKSSKAKLPVLKGLEIDGKIALIWSPDGLNDTGNAGPDCCCCGGNEVKAAKMINVNILAYALTH